MKRFESEFTPIQTKQLDLIDNKTYEICEAIMEGNNEKAKTNLNELYQILTSSAPGDEVNEFINPNKSERELGWIKETMKFWTGCYVNNHLEWNMGYIGEIVEQIAYNLIEAGNRVYYPWKTERDDGKKVYDVIFDYYCEDME